MRAKTKGADHIPVGLEKAILGFGDGNKGTNPGKPKGDVHIAPPLPNPPPDILSEAQMKEDMSRSAPKDVPKPYPWVGHTSEHASQVPYWEAKDHPKAFHTTIRTEEWNHAWVEGARVRSMEELIRKLNMLISIAASVAVLNLALLIIFISHISMTK